MFSFNFIPNFVSRFSPFLILFLFSCADPNRSDEVKEEQRIEIDSTDWKKSDLSILLHPIDSLFKSNADSIQASFLNILEVNKSGKKNYIQPDSIIEVNGLRIYFLTEIKPFEKDFPFTNHFVRAYDEYGWLTGKADLEFIGNDVRSEIVAKNYLLISNNYKGGFYSGEGASESQDSIARYEYFYISNKSLSSIDEIDLKALRILRTELLSNESELLPPNITRKETELINQIDRLLKNR